MWMRSSLQPRHFCWYLLWSNDCGSVVRIALIMHNYMGAKTSDKICLLTVLVRIRTFVAVLRFLMLAVRERRAKVDTKNALHYSLKCDIFVMFGYFLFIRRNRVNNIFIITKICLRVYYCMWASKNISALTRLLSQTFPLITSVAIYHFWIALFSKQSVTRSTAIHSKNVIFFIHFERWSKQTKSCTGRVINSKSDSLKIANNHKNRLETHDRCIWWLQRDNMQNTAVQHAEHYRIACTIITCPRPLQFPHCTFTLQHPTPVVN